MKIQVERKTLQSWSCCLLKLCERKVHLNGCVAYLYYVPVLKERGFEVYIAGDHSKCFILVRLDIKNTLKVNLYIQEVAALAEMNTPFNFSDTNLGFDIAYVNRFFGILDAIIF